MTIFNNFDEDFWDPDDDVTLGDLILTSLEETLPNMGNIACFKYDKNGKIDIKSSLFNNNKNAFHWLFNFISKKIPNFGLFLQDDDYCIDFGLKYYICHYMTLVFYCLFENNNDTQSRLFVETELKMNGFKIADFQVFYQLIRQFAVYNVCFPRHDRGEEAFYLQLFGKCLVIVLSLYILQYIPIDKYLRVYVCVCVCVPYIQMQQLLKI